jgi:hypothetical protein
VAPLAREMAEKSGGAAELPMLWNY